SKSASASASGKSLSVSKSSSSTSRATALRGAGGALDFLAGLGALFARALAGAALFAVGRIDERPLEADAFAEALLLPVFDLSLRPVRSSLSAMLTSRPPLHDLASSSRWRVSSCARSLSPLCNAI